MSGNKFADRIAKISKILQKNISEIVTSKYDKEMHKELNRFSEERQKIIDDIWLIEYNNVILNIKKLIDLSDNIPNQRIKFRTKNWF